MPSSTAIGRQTEIRGFVGGCLLIRGRRSPASDRAARRDRRRPAGRGRLPGRVPGRRGGSIGGRLEPGSAGAGRRRRLARAGSPELGARCGSARARAGRRSDAGSVGRRAAGLAGPAAGSARRGGVPETSRHWWPRAPPCRRRGSGTGRARAGGGGRPRRPGSGRSRRAAGRRGRARRRRAAGHRRPPAPPDDRAADHLDDLVEERAEVAPAILEHIEDPNPGDDVARGERLDERLDRVGVGKPQQVADAVFGQPDPRRGQELIQHRLGVAHAAGGKARDEVCRRMRRPRARPPRGCGGACPRSRPWSGAGRRTAGAATGSPAGSPGDAWRRT